MALLDRPLTAITEADLQRLIDTGACETTVIDFKRETYGESERARKDFLKDISSLANTSGGDVVIGMDENGGIPTQIVPLTGDADQEVVRLDNMARSGLEPRLPNFAVRPVPVGGGYVLIARARRSLVGPHRVIFNNDAQFWGRASAGIFPLNVEQLRRMFVEGPNLTQRVRSFFQERLVKIGLDQAPLQFGPGARKVVHVAALPAFADDRFADIVSVMANGHHVPLPLFGAGPNQGAVNLDGFLNFHRGGLRHRDSYAQFFRCGVIEGVAGVRVDEPGMSMLGGPALVNEMIAAVRQYAQVLDHYGAGEPLFAQVAIVDANDLHLHYGYVNSGGREAAQRVSVQGIENIVAPAVQFAPADDAATVLRPAFNVLWNAFGLARCDMYSDRGDFAGVE